MSKIKEARVDAGLTQKDVFEKIGIPIRTIQQWESGRRTPPEWVEKLVVEKLEQIAKDTKKDL